jgi:hypothetical protein
MTPYELYEKQVKDVLVKTKEQVNKRIEEIKAEGHEPQEIDYFDYTGECYKSALKVFKSLCDDDHSGMSYSITAGILKRMLDNLPLEKIQETDFTDDDMSWTMDDGTKHIMCDKMFSLLKEIHPDGTVTYSDSDRVVGINIDKGYSFCSGFVSDIINERYPITMPYYPDGRQYKVYVRDFLVYPENGDFDTQAILYIKTPDGEKIPVNKFYHEKNHEMVEITEDEYNELYNIYLNRVKSEK